MSRNNHRNRNSNALRALLEPVGAPAAAAAVPLEPRFSLPRGEFGMPANYKPVWEKVGDVHKAIERCDLEEIKKLITDPDIISMKHSFINYVAANGLAETRHTTTANETIVVGRAVARANTKSAFQTIHITTFDKIYAGIINFIKKVYSLNILLSFIMLGLPIILWYEEANCLYIVDVSSSIVCIVSIIDSNEPCLGNSVSTIF
jgi:hypothetical protein